MFELRAIFFLSIVFGVLNVNAQNLINGDLEGIPGSPGIPINSYLPMGWTDVPFTDANSLATGFNQATADLTNTTLPDLGGTIGIPNSGVSFVSGVHSILNGNTWHEGIMQSVDCFIPGDTYEIEFYQTIVKQVNCVDTSGSWAIYIDNNLIGVSSLSVSNLAYNSINLLWDLRSITFVATSVTHTVKFLPVDDDNSQMTSNTNLDGGLRMGLDNISITPTIPPVTPSGFLGNDTLICSSTPYVLDVSPYNGTYLWQDNSSASSFTVNQSGVHWVQITEPCGLVYFDSVTVTFDNGDINLGNDTILCDLNILILDPGNTDASYLWQDNSTASTYAVTQSGSYSVQSTNACGISFDTINVSMFSTPNVQLGNDTMLCYGAILLLDLTVTNVDYLWQDNSTNSFLIASQAGQYSVEVSNTCGTQIDFIQIDYSDPITTGNDTTLCEGSSIVLDAFGAMSYSWSNGVLNGEETYPTVGVNNYSVVGVNTFGCVSSGEIVVTVEPLPIASFDIDVQSGCAPQEFNFYNTSTGSPVSCQWYLNDALYWGDCSDFSIILNDPGLYDLTLEVISEFGCSDVVIATDYIEIFEPPTALFDPSSNTIFENESEIIFTNNSIGATNYYWSFGDESVVSDEFSPVHDFVYINDVSYQIELIAYTNNGCSDTAYCIIEPDISFSFYVPNSFTPDGSEFNNLFFPIFSKPNGLAFFEIQVFNRWGETVWVSYSPLAGWDGTYNGRIVQSGAYVWKIILQESSTIERSVYLGHINVLR